MRTRMMQVWVQVVLSPLVLVLLQAYLLCLETGVATGALAASTRRRPRTIFIGS